MVTAPSVVGICGAGMMGSAFGGRLVEGGLPVLTFDPSTSEETAARIADAGMVRRDALADLVGEVDVLLSIMGSAVAPVFAEQVGMVLERNPRQDLVFAECNLIAPRTAREVSDRLSALGVRVVDAGICGAPPRQGHAPAVFLAGPHTGEMEFLASHGFEVWAVGEEIGQASALKVCSAAGWQGCVALISEVLIAARRYGMDGWLLRDLAAHQGQLHDWFVPALLEAVPKAARWAPDMGVIADTFAEVGSSGAYHTAAGGLYEAMRHLSAGGTNDPLQVVAGLADLGAADGTGGK